MAKFKKSDKKERIFGRPKFPKRGFRKSDNHFIIFKHDISCHITLFIPQILLYIITTYLYGLQVHKNKVPWGLQTVIWLRVRVNELD
jgi:hypothetical protein